MTARAEHAYISMKFSCSFVQNDRSTINLIHSDANPFIPVRTPKICEKLHFLFLMFADLCAAVKLTFMVLASCSEYLARRLALHMDAEVLINAPLSC